MKLYTLQNHTQWFDKHVELLTQIFSVIPPEGIALPRLKELVGRHPTHLLGALTENGYLSRTRAEHVGVGQPAYVYSLNGDTLKNELAAVRERASAHTHTQVPCLTPTEARGRRKRMALHTEVLQSIPENGITEDDLNTLLCRQLGSSTLRTLLKWGYVTRARLGFDGRGSTKFLYFLAQGAQEAHASVLNAEVSTGAQYQVAHRQQQADKVRDGLLRRLYGITLITYNEMLLRQGNHCGICPKTEPGSGRKHWAVDHCHKTKTVRGLLCIKCNSAIGMLGDDAEGVLRAYRYLRPYNVSSTLIEEHY